MLRTALHHAFNAVRRFASGYLPLEQRFHPEFTHLHEFWHVNRHFNPHRVPSRVEALKMRVYLNKGDMDKFNDCPFSAKIGENIDKTKPYDFCAFIYPRQDGVIEPVKAWVEARRFALTNVLTAGHYRPDGRWKPGEAYETS